jgi:hypothetical protein
LYAAIPPVTPRTTRRPRSGVSEAVMSIEARRARYA